MYSFVRQKLHGGSERKLSTVEPSVSVESTYKSYKCKISSSGSYDNKLIANIVWVHPENILEVKTYILRRLPVLVYNPVSSKDIESGQSDPFMTSLYFDNPQFALYDRKVSRAPGASSLRLRWYGHLDKKPEILFEKKVEKENGESLETRFPIKDKYVQSFISGEYKLEKSVEKLRERQRGDDNSVAQLEKSIDDIQSFIKENELQPVLRANYTRTAFQIPGDDRVRISIDTDMAFIREDSLDSDRPCRNPEEWHRKEIDEAEMEFPFPAVRQGEISRFPFALLEIRVRDTKKRTNEWMLDLMSSHLVKEAPKFSKFVHGVAQLFEDYVNSFPFWLSDLETDIRKDPEAAFQEEQGKKAKKAEDELAVGSFAGGKSASSLTPAVASPFGKSPAKDSDRRQSAPETNADDDETDHEVGVSNETTLAGRGRIRSLLPSFSGSKYARAHRQARPVRLPPGVRDPGKLIKDSAPVRVEPKVWLANQRTFIKWQHISVLLASLSLGLFNAAGEQNNVARILAVVYTLVAIFAGAWGWWQYLLRSRMIQERSGKDFDNIVGPIIVCVGLVIALCLNFGFKVGIRNACWFGPDSLLTAFKVSRRYG